MLVAAAILPIWRAGLPARVLLALRVSRHNVRMFRFAHAALLCCVQTQRNLWRASEELQYLLRARKARLPASASEARFFACERGAHWAFVAANGWGHSPLLRYNAAVVHVLVTLHCERAIARRRGFPSTGGAGACDDYPPLYRYSAASGDGNTGRSIGDRVCGGSSARPLAF